MNGAKPRSSVALVARKMGPESTEVLIMLLMLGLAFVGAVAGFIIGQASEESETPAAATAPSGHSGKGHMSDAYTGAVWYQWWHGRFIAMEE